MRSLVLRYVREHNLLRAGDRVCVAVSGGADSVALLRVLLELRAELGIVPFAAHVNHGLRGQASDADEAFVEQLAREHDLNWFLLRETVGLHPLTRKLGIEGAARQLRYRFLLQIAEQQRAAAIATGHTLDDQAETVLLKFLRGAGTRGLAGIYPSVAKSGGQLHIVRPLLDVTREQIEAYLSELGQSWREDESNRDPRFKRNRVRHGLLPLLTGEYNPNFRQVLSDVAETARAEEEYWQALVRRELEERTSTDHAGSLALKSFSGLPLALQRRVLKSFAEMHEVAIDFAHVEQLRLCALGKLPRTRLWGDWLAERKGDCLVLCGPGTSKPASLGYEYTLPVPGKIRILEVDLELDAVVLSEDEAQREVRAEYLLSAVSVIGEVTVRNWRPGDRFWPVASGSEDKLKRLFLEAGVPADQRPSWPLIVQGTQIVWVRGLPVARSHAWNGEGEAIKIELR